MSAIFDDDEDVLAGLKKGEHPVVVNPRELRIGISTALLE